MTTLFELTRRNLKVFFKDKGRFISALITPIILLVLYATFLARVYKESFLSAIPETFAVDEKIISATVAGQLISSLLAVSCVTIAFCANLLMITDKADGQIRDLTVTPVKRAALAGSYFLATAASTLIVTISALAFSLLYLSTQGWFLSVGDVVCLVFDVLLLTLFGTALSSCIHFFLSTNGQASAAGTIVSTGYGFICGAYMPIASFSPGLQKVLSFLPGTYGTALVKNHMMRGVFAEMSRVGFPDEAIDGIKSGIDCTIKFFGKTVSVPMMYVIMTAAVVFFTGLFVLLHVFFKRKR
ncbi:MAG: ABC transporter permease [Clostridia bacterium]|nr:ABC transporter permease [Clostridia bacterium]